MARTRVVRHRDLLVHNRESCATSPNSWMRRWMATLRSTYRAASRSNDKQLQHSQQPRVAVTRGSSAKTVHGFRRSVPRVPRSASPLLVDVSSVAGPLPCPTWWKQLQHEHERLRLAAAITAQRLWEIGALTAQSTPTAATVAVASHTQATCGVPTPLAQASSGSIQPPPVKTLLRRKKQVHPRAACLQPLPRQQPELITSPPSVQPSLAVQSASASPLPLFLRTHLHPQLLSLDADGEWSAAQLLECALLLLPSPLRARLSSALVSLSCGTRRLLSTTPGSCGSMVDLSPGSTLQLHVHAPHPLASGLQGGSSSSSSSSLACLCCRATAAAGCVCESGTSRLQPQNLGSMAAIRVYRSDVLCGTFAASTPAEALLKHPYVRPAAAFGTVPCSLARRGHGSFAEAPQYICGPMSAGDYDIIDAVPIHQCAEEPSSAPIVGHAKATPSGAASGAAASAEAQTEVEEDAEDFETSGDEPTTHASARVDVLYLQADPFRMSKSDAKEVYSIVDFSRALETVVSSLEDNGRAVRYRTGVATVENLRAAITDGCRVLHLSMHGMSRTEVTQKRNQQTPGAATATAAAATPAAATPAAVVAVDALASDEASAKEKAALIFEDEWGEPHDLHADDLKELVSAGESFAPSNMLAIVTSCHGEDACTMLVASGFQHVIGIEAVSTIDMEACSKFVRQFYKALFSGRSVADSFDIGTKTVGAGRYHGEARKFRLWPSDEQHSEVLFPRNGAGSLLDGRAKPIGPQLPRERDFAHFPALPARCVPRSTAVRLLVRDLEKHRLVLLSGIGSSTVANLAARNLSLRNPRLIVQWVCMRQDAFTTFTPSCPLQSYFREAANYPHLDFLYVFDNAHHAENRTFMESLRWSQEQSKRLAALVQLSNVHVLFTTDAPVNYMLHPAQFRRVLSPPGPMLLAWMFWCWLPTGTKVPPMPTPQQWADKSHAGFPCEEWCGSRPPGEGDALVSCIEALSRHQFLRCVHASLCPSKSDTDTKAMSLARAVQCANLTSIYTLNGLLDKAVEAEKQRVAEEEERQLRDRQRLMELKSLNPGYFEWIMERSTPGRTAAHQTPRRLRRTSDLEPDESAL